MPLPYLASLPLQYLSRDLALVAINGIIVLQSTIGTQSQNGSIIYVKGVAAPQLALLALDTTLVTETGTRNVHQKGVTPSLLDRALRDDSALTLVRLALPTLRTLAALGALVSLLSICYGATKMEENILADY